MRTAFDKNPFSGFSVIDDNGSVRGFVEMWAIQRDRLCILLNNTIQETDLEADDFLSYNDNINEFYVSITLPPISGEERGLRHLQTNLLLSAINGFIVLGEKAYLDHRTPANEKNFITLFAIAETDEGERFSLDLGFSLETELTSQRKLNGSDRPIYSLHFSLEMSRDIRKKYGITMTRNPVHFRELRKK